MLDDNQTDNHKVIGGLSTDRLLMSFDETCNESASLNIWQVDSPSLTFKNINRTIINIDTNDEITQVAS